MGAGFGVLAGRGRTRLLRQGFLFGLGVWLTWMFAIVPLTSLTRPPVLVIDELRRQPPLRPRSDAERRRTSVA